MASSFPQPRLTEREIARRRLASVQTSTGFRVGDVLATAILDSGIVVPATIPRCCFLEDDGVTGCDEEAYVEIGGTRPETTFSCLQARHIAGLIGDDDTWVAVL